MIMSAHDIDIIGVMFRSKAGYSREKTYEDHTKAFKQAFFGISLL